MVRPEQFILGPAGSDIMAARVKAVRFFGSYYELEIALAETIIRVRAGATELAAGDTAYVSVAAGSGWELVH
jgi:iron(III) transport system ATP-binding protein